MDKIRKISICKIRYNNTLMLERLTGTLFTMWGKWGWYRVTYYGDLKRQTYDLADAIGWKVIEEA